MPMFCSSKPQVVILSTTVTTLLFFAFYMTSDLLSKQYDDPGLFKPNSQDYFRTSLLGIFSPILYCFIKTFLFNVNRRYLILNLLVDFPLNDWFILFIIICLAYPQQEQNKFKEATNLWHIIPRQSYIFGIAWSLGEFIICVTGNLFTYQEIPANISYFPKTSSGNSRVDGENVMYDTNEDDDQEDSGLKRENITLSKCVGVRRNSSTISHNVYCSEPNSRSHDYGTLRTNEQPNVDKNKVIQSRTGTTTTTADNERNQNGDDTIVMVDPTDNSLRLTSLELEEGNLNAHKNSPLLNEHQQHWGSYGNMLVGAVTNSGNGGTAIPVKKFPPVNTRSDLFHGILLLCLVLASNILLTIGQSLIASIYFIYVPGHEHLFTPVVNFFGKRTISHFLLVVMVPFTVLNLFINVLIYLWKDLDDWFNKSPEYARSHSHASTRNYYEYYDSDISLHRSRQGSMTVPDMNLSAQISAPPDPSTLMLMASPSDYHYYYNASNEEYDSGSPKILIIAKNIIGSWKNLARKDPFVLTTMLLWGVLIYTTGIWCTILF